MRGLYDNNWKKAVFSIYYAGCKYFLFSYLIINNNNIF